MEQEKRPNIYSRVVVNKDSINESIINPRDRYYKSCKTDYRLRPMSDSDHVIETK